MNSLFKISKNIGIFLVLSAEYEEHLPKLNVQFRKTRKKYYVHFFKRSNIFCAKTMPAEDSLHKNVQLPLHFEGRLSEDEQKRGKIVIYIDIS